MLAKSAQTQARKPVGLLDKHKLLLAAVWDKNLRGSDHAVLGFLLEKYRDDKGYAACSSRNMANDLCMGRNKVQDCVKRLIEQGYLLYNAGNPYTLSRYIPMFSRVAPKEEPDVAPKRGPGGPQVVARCGSQAGASSSSYSPVKRFHLVTSSNETDLDLETETETPQHKSSSHTRTRDALDGMDGTNLADYARQNLFPDEDESMEDDDYNPVLEPAWLRKTGVDVHEEVLKIAKELKIRQPEMKLTAAAYKWIKYQNKNPRTQPRTAVAARGSLKRWISMESF